MSGEGSGFMDAKQCYSDACNEENDEKRLELLRKAQSYAANAFGSEPENAAVLSTLCSVTNALVEESPSLEEKSKYGCELKEYLDKALQVSPCNGEFLDMRARFEYKFSMMDNRERRSVRRLPETSLDQALQDFCALDKFAPNVTEYTFLIGKIYDAMADYKNAQIYLNKVLEMSTDPDCEFANEAKQILSRSVYPVHDNAEADYD